MSIINVLADREKQIKETAAERIRQATKLVAMWQEKMAVLQCNLSGIKAGLAKAGLMLPDDLSASVRKSGGNPEIWVDGDKLVVELVALPINGKFKFLTFRGYDARGRGKNADRLCEKATKLQALLKDSCAIEGIQVNPSSLEIRNDREGRVLITLWF